jgi:hypothetical protein
MCDDFEKYYITFMCFCRAFQAAENENGVNKQKNQGFV